MGRFFRRGGGTLWWVPSDGTSPVPHELTKVERIYDGRGGDHVRFEAYEKPPANVEVPDFSTTAQVPIPDRQDWLMRKFLEAKPGPDRIGFHPYQYDREAFIPAPRRVEVDIPGRINIATGNREETTMPTVTTSETLRREAEKLLERATALESRPRDDFDIGEVITFAKTHDVEDPTGEDEDTHTYTYAAIKIDTASVKEKMWVLSGEVNGGKYSWAQLLDFVESQGGTVDGLFHCSGLTEIWQP